MSGLMSGENFVGPPVPPTRNSLTRFLVRTERTDPCHVNRSESCRPWNGKPGNTCCRELVVSGFDSSWFRVVENDARCFDVRL